MADFPVYLERLFSGLKKLKWLGRQKQSPMPGGVSPNAPATDPTYQWFQRQLEIGYDRSSRYHEYDLMDRESVEICAALNYYADDATQVDRHTGKKIWVESKFPEIAAIGNDLFEQRLEADSLVWSQARSTAKRGDRFMKHIIDVDHPEKGVMGWKPSPANSIRRIEDDKANLLGFRYDPYMGLSVNVGVHAKDPKKDLNKFFSPWDYTHFRILGDDEDDRYAVYGKSMLEPARPIFKRLKLLEEMLMLYRATRSVDRMVYYVDVGDMPPDRAMDTIRMWRRMYKRDQFLDPSSGNFTMTWNPHALDEDIFWPLREGVNSRVEKLPGGVDVNGIADIEYFADKMYLAIAVPREYLSGQSTGMIQIGGGQSLAQKDVRYARTVSRVQSAVIEGYTRVLEIHLALLGIDPDRSRFQVKMAAISNIDEMQKLDVMQGKTNVAQSLTMLLQGLGADQTATRLYVLSEVLAFPDDVIQRLTPPPAPMLPPSPDGSTPAPQDQQAPAPDQAPPPQESEFDAAYKDLLHEMEKQDSSYIETLQEALQTSRSVKLGHEPLPNSGWEEPSRETLEEFDSMLASATASIVAEGLGAKNGSQPPINEVDEDA